MLETLLQLNVPHELSLCDNISIFILGLLKQKFRRLCCGMKWNEVKSCLSQLIQKIQSNYVTNYNLLLIISLNSILIEILNSHFQYRV